MAFTVTLKDNSFRISVGDHRPVRAQNVDEVKEALSHYYAKPYHSAPQKGCPFCQADSNA